MEQREEFTNTEAVNLTVLNIVSGIQSS